MKKIIKMMLCLSILSLVLPFQQISVYALTNDEKAQLVLKAEQISLSAEIIDAMEEAGLDYQTILEFFELEEKDGLFYDSDLFTDEEVADHIADNNIAKFEPQTPITQMTGITGNPPQSAREQADRMTYIYSVANTTFSHLSTQRFEDYVYYLYMSHYVDNHLYNPANPNFNNIFATYICATDVTVYDTFKNISVGTAIFNNAVDMTELVFDTSDVLSLEGLEKTQDRLTLFFYMLNSQDNINAVVSAQEFIEYYISAYNEASTASQLIEVINDNLLASNYYDNFEGKGMVELLLGIATSATPALAYLQYTAVQMDFYSDLITGAALVALGATFNNRQAGRQMVYLGWDPRPN